MARIAAPFWQSVATPVITTALYFVVFGGAIGSRIHEVGGVGYGAFIVPGLIMLSLLTQSISNASIGIYFPEIHRHLFRVPVGAALAARGGLRLCRRGRDKVGVGRPDHPGHRDTVRAGADHASRLDGGVPRADLGRFSLFGFIIGIWAEDFEQLAIIPALVVTPLTFLGGAFYSIDMLPPLVADGEFVQSRRLSCQRVSLELLRRGRRRRRGRASAFIAAFMVLCLAFLWWIFRTGYRLKP